MPVLPFDPAGGGGAPIAIDAYPLWKPSSSGGSYTINDKVNFAGSDYRNFKGVNTNTTPNNDAVNWVREPIDTLTQAEFDALVLAGDDQADIFYDISDAPILRAESVTTVADIATRDAITTQQEGDTVRVLDNGAGQEEMFVWDGAAWLNYPAGGLGGFIEGSVLFMGPNGILQANSNLFWDNTNRRFSVGTNLPTVAQEIVGDDNSNGQVLVRPSSNISQSAFATIRGARTSAVTDPPSEQIFENFDNDIASLNKLGSVGGLIENNTTNIGALGFFYFPDGSTRTLGMRITSSGHFEPGADLARNLGSASLRYLNAYIGTLRAFSGILLGPGQIDLQTILDSKGSFLGSFGPNDALYTLPDPAVAMVRNGRTFMWFDDTTTEQVIREAVMSSDYLSGLSVNIDWVSETETSGNATFGVSFERLASNGNNVDSDNFAAEKTGTGASNASNGKITRTTIVFTASEAADIVAGESFRIKLRRGGLTGDTMSNDAQVLSVSWEQ